MKRTAARELAIQLCFAASSAGVAPMELMDEFFSPEYYSTLSQVSEEFAEYPDDKQMAYIRRLVGLVTENLSEIDGFIERYSHGWRPERISRTALNVLRCAICEILYMDDIPDATAINEAVEIDKGYDEPDAVAFVNGVLGGFYRGEIDKTAKADTEE